MSEQARIPARPRRWTRPVVILAWLVFGLALPAAMFAALINMVIGMIEGKVTVCVFTIAAAAAAALPVYGGAHLAWAALLAGRTGQQRRARG